MKRSSRLGTAISSSGERSAMNAVGSSSMTRVCSLSGQAWKSWDQAEDRRVPARGQDPAVGPVLVEVTGAEVRDDHPDGNERPGETPDQDRKSTRLNSSHSQISYAV